MTLTNYTIKQTIGQGGMATVYLAEDFKFQTNVAIKVLNKEFIHNDNIRKRFIAEARNMYKMSHPNIIKVTDLIDEGETVAFVMEYIDGETLKEYLDKKGKLSEKKIKALFAQMLEAVGYVHEQGLIHRDIKPSNFMITPKGQIKLLDFGIAKNTDTNSADYTQTGTTQNMGTPIYMSPEQIKSTKAVTLQSDIYSLGVVLWQMVMGKKPYNTNTTSTFELQTKIVTENLSLTNSSFDTIIKVATEKDCNIRYNNCNEIKFKLENLHKEITDKSNHNTSDVSEKTIVDDSNDKTIVDNNIIGTVPQPSLEIPNTTSEANNNSVSVNKKSSKKKIIIGAVVGVICILVSLVIWKNTPKHLYGIQDKNSVLEKFDYYGTVSLFGGLPDGKGVATYYQGHIYDGEYKNGLREGHGIWTYNNGHKYEGEFKNNTFNGQFFITTKEGIQSQADFISNYTYVEIGNQAWMSQNLYNNYFQNGDPIPEAKTNEEWLQAGKSNQPAWCYYNNDIANSGYGKLYNWYAVNDPRGLAPDGWHIPSDSEWKTLTTYLGGEKVAGPKMKSNYGWVESGYSNNTSGFTALPGGYRNFSNGLFLDLGSDGNWWCSSEIDNNIARSRTLYIGYIDRDYDGKKGNGFSVRCVKN
jgi:uncharacterized protein (TIGR02145 family)